MTSTPERDKPSSQTPRPPQKTLQESNGWRVGRLEKIYRRSRWFTWSLNTQQISHPLRLIADPWRGSAAAGGHILQNILPGTAEEPAYHLFSWLRDIREYGGASARSFAREHIINWFRRYQNWDERLWRPDYLGQRLSTLLFTYDWYASSADESFQQDLTHMLEQQLNCLARDWPRLTGTSAQITALKGLIIGQAILHQNAEDVEHLMDIVLPKIKTQLNQDGGHKSRQPETHLMLLRDLYECRTACGAVGLSENPAMEDMLMQMAATAKMWRHGDGSFAYFQQAGALDAHYIEEVLQRCGTRSRTAQQAPHTGYIRMASGRNTLIMDAGGPTSATPDSIPSTLAFEFSVAQARFIVNSGQHASDPRLAGYLNQTVAHSTLTLDGIDSSDASTGRWAQMANVEVGPTADGQLAMASHNGYGPSHGILHQRQIYLANGGGNLRGADQLEYTGAPGEIPTEAIIRFHLHPRVSAALIQGERVMMKIRGQRAGWTFMARGCQVRLDNSIYIEKGRRTICQQIVLHVPLADIRTIGNVAVNWAFRRAAGTAKTARDS